MMKIRLIANYFVFAALFSFTSCKYHMISRENLNRPQLNFVAKDPLSYSFHDYTNWRIKPALVYELNYNTVFTKAKEIENIEQANPRHIVFAFSCKPSFRPWEIFLIIPPSASLALLPGYGRNKCGLTANFYFNRAYTGRFEAFENQHAFVWVPAALFQSNMANSEIIRSLFFRMVRSVEFRSFMEGI